MADDGIDVDLDDLTLVMQRLARFSTEFDELGDRVERVKDAVGKPAGDSRLSSRVDDFAAGWDGNREVVQESLTNVRNHLGDFVKDLQEQDRALAGDQ